MHTHKQLFFFPLLSILHCSQTTYDDSSGRVVPVLAALGRERFKTGGRSFASAWLSQSSLGGQAGRQPLLSDLGAYVATSSFPAKPWPALAGSTAVLKRWFQSCRVPHQSSSQTKPIQAGSGAGKREGLQPRHRAGADGLCAEGSEGQAGELLPEERKPSHAQNAVSCLCFFFNCQTFSAHTDGSVGSGVWSRAAAGRVNRASEINEVTLGCSEKRRVK